MEMWHKKLKAQQGQALVEMALVLPIFLILIIGITNFGFIFSSQLTANQAAREGARFLAVYEIDPPDADPTTPEYNGDITVTNLYAHLSNYTAFLKDFDVFEIKTVNYGPDWTTAEVHVSANVDLITPFLGWLLDGAQGDPAVDEKYQIANDGKYRVHAAVIMRVE